MGPVYGQYVSQIYGGYLFHSAWYHVNGNKQTLSVSEYRKLGQNASHGCVRLTVADAKWIYDNCNGSTVTVYSSPNMDNMFDKPVRPNQLLFPAITDTIQPIPPLISVAKRSFSYRNSFLFIFQNIFLKNKLIRFIIVSSLEKIAIII